MSKYLSRKVKVGDLTFDSVKEHRHWHALQMRQRAGEITGLERQVKRPLAVNGVTVANVIVDFAYVENGVQIFEDTKSEMTRKLPVWRLKTKLFSAIYGQRIREV